MRTSRSAMAQVLADAGRGVSWRDIDITARDALRRALVKKHGSLTKAAENLEVNYQTLSDVIGGRRHIIDIVTAIQHDLELSDVQVLGLWPLLRTWPRESRMVS